MTKLAFTVAEERCIQCDSCVNDCPVHIIARSGGAPTVPPESEGACIACQHCLAVCPTGAVSVFGLSSENSVTLTPEAFPSLRQMETLARGRRSVRRFRQENVSRKIIDELLAATANAPTGGNTCDLTFSVVDDRAELNIVLEKLVQALETKIASGTTMMPFLIDNVNAYRKGGTDNFFRGAPHLLIISAGARAYCAPEDVALTLAYFELLAACAGLGTTWCGALKFAMGVVPEFRATLGLGPDTPYYAMMFGMPGVHYARTVQRDNAATIRTIKMS